MVDCKVAEWYDEWWQMTLIVKQVEACSILVFCGLLPWQFIVGIAVLLVVVVDVSGIGREKSG